MKHYLFMVVICACAILNVAHAQNSVAESAVSACPQPDEVRPIHLYGVWRADFEGGSPSATILFERHPELAGSVRGGVNRDGITAQIAGDVDNGEFTLEESHDGKRIDANWLGAVIVNSCGKEIRGTWNKHSNQTSHAFVLRKLPGWQ